MNRTSGTSRVTDRDMVPKSPGMKTLDVTGNRRGIMQEINVEITQNKKRGSYTLQDRVEPVHIEHPTREINVDNTEPLSIHPHLHAKRFNTPGRVRRERELEGRNGGPNSGEETTPMPPNSTGRIHMHIGD